MVIILNPKAHGGTAGTRWKQLEPRLSTQLGDDYEVLTLNGGTRNELQRRILAGERDVVAAGGDGTVNAVLQMLMDLPRFRHQGVRLGAIGLGANNDYHKPVKAVHIQDGISCKLDVFGARRRDIGVLEYLEGKTWQRRYWLLNASMGITAEANAFFNNGSTVPRFLKQRFTAFAMLYATFRTILTHRNRGVSITSGNSPSMQIPLSNLSVMKSPHVSGNLLFDVPWDIHDGYFTAHLSYDMNHGRLFRFVLALLGGLSTKFTGTQVWRSGSLEVSAAQRFPIEYDGEIVFTKRARFSIAGNGLRVCT